MQQRNRLLSLHWIVLFAMLFTIGAPAVNPAVQASTPNAPVVHKIGRSPTGALPISCKAGGFGGVDSTAALLEGAWIVNSITKRTNQCSDK